MTDVCQCCRQRAAERRVAGYDVAVCGACWADAAGGWPPAFEAELTAGLSREGRFVPDRTENGRLPREYLPPRDFPI